MVAERQNFSLQEQAPLVLGQCVAQARERSRPYEELHRLMGSIGGQEFFTFFRKTSYFNQVSQACFEGFNTPEGRDRFQRDFSGFAFSLMGHAVVSELENEKGNIVITGSGVLDICKLAYPTAKERKRTFGNTTLESTDFNSKIYVPDGFIVNSDMQIIGNVEYKFGIRNSRLRKQKLASKDLMGRLIALGICEDNPEFLCVRTSPEQNKRGIVRDTGVVFLPFTRAEFIRDFRNSLFNSSRDNRHSLSSRESGFNRFINNRYGK